MPDDFMIIGEKDAELFQWGNDVASPVSGKTRREKIHGYPASETLD